MLARLNICSSWHQRRALAVGIVVVGSILGACVDNEVVLGPCCSASAEETFSLQADATGRTRFRLTGVNGTINVVGASATQTVRIEGIRRVESSSQADADDNLPNLQVEVSQTAADVAVRTVQPSNTGNRNFIVEYEITVPQNLTVQVTNVNGNVTVNAVDNDVDVVNTNGNVSLQGITGNAFVDLVNGNVSAEVTPSISGTIDLMSVNGNLTLAVPTTVSAVLSMALTNGTLSVVNLTVQNQVSSSMNLSGTLGNGDGAITMRTTNGNIVISGF